MVSVPLYHGFITATEISIETTQGEDERSPIKGARVWLGGLQCDSGSSECFLEHYSFLTAIRQVKLTLLLPMV